MRVKLATALLVLAFAVPAAISATGVAKPARHTARLPANLEGMDYAKARLAVLTRGWKPSSGHCHAGQALCTKYPEIDTCSASYKILCAMDFVQKGQCLVVSTSGETAPGQGGRDPVVTNVIFLRGPCALEMQ